MKKIRYAVVGLGHIAQTAVLPAFKNAERNSELVALVSSDPIKLRKLSKTYKVPTVYLENEYEKCLESPDIDAVYIATPNTDHQYYVEKAAAKGIHVLCEKPMAASLGAGASILHAVKRGNIKMMVGYRLHFDPGNLKAVQIARSKKLGDLRIFNSVFSFQVEDTENTEKDVDYSKLRTRYRYSNKEKNLIKRTQYEKIISRDTKNDENLSDDTFKKNIFSK